MRAADGVLEMGHLSGEILSHTPYVEKALGDRLPERDGHGCLLRPGERRTNAESAEGAAWRGLEAAAEQQRELSKPQATLGIPKTKKV